MTIQASVILCVRNGAATIGEQLQALSDQDYGGSWELVVVDNGSIDGSWEIVESWRDRLPRARLVRANESVGLGYARNVGARAAAGGVLAFCDADDVADRGWVRALVDAAQDGELVAGHLDHTLLNGDTARSWRGVADSVADQRLGLGYLPYATGANFAVRRQTFEAVGGCDEQFTICGDDLDLSWRIQQAGGRLVIAADAIMHYRLRDDLRGVLRQRHRYGFAEAMLRRKFRDVIPPMRGKARRRSVYRLLAHSWQLAAGPRRRGEWLVRASHIAGQLRGSLKYRVWA